MKYLRHADKLLLEIFRQEAEEDGWHKTKEKINLYWGITPYLLSKEIEEGIKTNGTTLKEQIEIIKKQFEDIWANNPDEEE